MIPGELKYTKEHEWVKIDNDQATFGITEHAQSEMGDVTLVEVPEKEASIEQSKAFSTIESVKAASEIYAPLSGSVTDTNEELINKPELINESPYEKGWICKIKLSNPAEADKLMDAMAYQQYLETLKK